MRIPSVALLLLLALPAHAKEFTCESAKPADAVGGWITLPLKDQPGNIELELRQGAYPFVLVDAPLATASFTEGGLRYESDADKHNQAVAVLEIPGTSIGKDAFSGEVKITGPGKPVNYTVNCRAGE
jgi:hypothetical protein